VTSQLPMSIAEILDPERTALLLWDVQDGVANQAHNVEELFPVLTKLVGGARQAEVPVIWARHVQAPLAFTPPAKLQHQLRSQGLTSIDQMKRTEDGQFLAELGPREGELAIDKPTQSFFIGTSLEISLRGLGIDSLVLAGVATEMGVELTARHAGALGFFVSVVEDGVGSFTQSGHDIGMAYLRSPSALYIDLVSSESVLEVWGR
jgi:nicotinamidase-related amidase